MRTAQRPKLSYFACPFAKGSQPTRWGRGSIQLVSSYDSPHMHASLPPFYPTRSQDDRRVSLARSLGRIFLLNLLLAIGITALLLRQLIIKTSEIIQEREYTQILEIPYWPTAIFMTVGMTLFLLVLLLRLFETCIARGD